VLTPNFASDLEVIRALPFVVYANVYHQDLVVKSRLEEKAVGRLAKPISKGDEEKRYYVYVIFHHESATRSNAELRQHLAEIVCKAELLYLLTALLFVTSNQGLIGLKKF